MKLSLLASALFSVTLASGSEWYTPNVPHTILFDVEVEHIRTAKLSKRHYRSEYHKSEDYTREMQSVSVNLGAEVPTPAGVSVSANIGIEHVKETEQKTTSESKVITEDEEHYQPGKNQIERIVSITTKINGQTLKSIKRAYVDIEGDGNRLNTRQMSIDYLNSKYVDPGKPLATRARKTFGIMAMGCKSRREVLYRDRCYTHAAMQLSGYELWGYDGAFYPSPEPYMYIDSNGVRLYQSDYDSRHGQYCDANPTFYGNIALGRSLGAGVHVTLYDHDTDSGNDLMCDLDIDRSDLLENLAEDGDSHRSLNCRYGGSAKIVFSL